MSVDRISLDANILFYAIDVDAGERHEQAKEIVTRSARDFDCILALQSLAEFFASTTRKGKLTPAEAAEQVEDWQVTARSSSAASSRRSSTWRRP